MIVRPGSIALIGACGLLSGCGGPIAPVTGKRAADAARFVVQDQAPLEVRGFRIWYANGTAGDLACGSFASPDPSVTGGDRIRFIYDFGSGARQIEYHHGWTAAHGITAEIVENRKIFNNIWSEYCAAFEPKRFWQL